MKRASYLIAVVFVTAIAAGCTAPGRGIAPDTIWVFQGSACSPGERAASAMRDHLRIVRKAVDAVNLSG